MINIMRFCIPLAPVSKKNSQQIMLNQRSGKPFIMPSKAFKEYETAAMFYVPKWYYIDYPVNIECHFYMETRRKVDLTNLLEAIDDVMVKAGLLADDNYTVIQSHDGSRVFYDKNRPRTEIRITKAVSEENNNKNNVT